MNIDHYKQLFETMKKRAVKTKEDSRGQALKIIAGLTKKAPHQRAAEFAQTAFNIVFDGKIETGTHPGAEKANIHPGHECGQAETATSSNRNDVLEDIKEAILNNTLCIDRLTIMHEELIEALKQGLNSTQPRKAGRPTKDEERKRQEELKEHAKA